VGRQTNIARSVEFLIDPADTCQFYKAEIATSKTDKYCIYSYKSELRPATQTQVLPGACLPAKRSFGKAFREYMKIQTIKKFILPDPVFSQTGLLWTPPSGSEVSQIMYDVAAQF
jgi:hypothetical protein